MTSKFVINPITKNKIVRGGSLHKRLVSRGKMSRRSLTPKTGHGYRRHYRRNGNGYRRQRRLSSSSPRRRRRSKIASPSSQYRRHSKPASRSPKRQNAYANIIRGASPQRTSAQRFAYLMSSPSQRARARYQRARSRENSAANRNRRSPRFSATLAKRGSIERGNDGRMYIASLRRNNSPYWKLIRFT